MRLLVLVVLSIFLMLSDRRLEWLQPLRSELGRMQGVMYWLADMPLRIWSEMTESLVSREELVADNERLKAEALVMQRRLQKLAALTEQNVRLRELLNSSSLVDDKVLATELIGVAPDPLQHRVIIDKGARDGVFIGQPVLDARGLVGQVVDVMPYSATVLLITDSTHAVPVQVNRNGVRAIAGGTGDPDTLELRYVAETADIRPGDILVSSGLGQRFPAGYPVAVVTQVDHDTGQPFAAIRATPTAALNRSRHLLLVFSDPRSPEERANDAAKAQEIQDAASVRFVGPPLPPGLRERGHAQ